MPGFVQRSFFQRTFVHNIGLKLVSLLLAIGLWLVVARDPIAEVEMKVPIEFRNLPDNLEIDSASFTEAQIRVRGPERVIHRLQTADVRAEIDLASVQPGERTFDLNGAASACAAGSGSGADHTRVSFTSPSTIARPASSRFGRV